jgi:hypothetical protein
MSSKKDKQSLPTSIERQRHYVEAQKKGGNGLGIVFADAFLRGMRDLGYKSPSWALAEQLDNSFQAGATTVGLRFGFNRDNKSRAKPDQIALIDNGDGMIPEMISYAVRWGGTDRENDRKGLGRYGYGLPSSAVSIAKRYTVYSKTVDTAWHAVTVDIEALAATANSQEGTQTLLMPREAAPPDWVTDVADAPDVKTMDSGTVVILEELDRLKRQSGWIKCDTLRTKLLQDFGVIYRHWIPERKIIVDGVVAQAVDPLFLLEHGRFYDENRTRARPVETRSIVRQSSRGLPGTIRIRASVMPPSFQLVDPDLVGQKGAKTNSRFRIMKENNGILVCRERRQIDCVVPTWTKFQNHDYNIKIEIDFDPELDEFFGITTAKQQIVIDEETWEVLRNGGKGGGDLGALIKDLRDQFEQFGEEEKAGTENTVRSAAPRPSVQAMVGSEKFKQPEPTRSPRQREESERNLDNAAQTRAKERKTSVDRARVEIIEETQTHGWQVEFAATPEGPFYRPYRLGEQKRVIINTEHPFFTKVFDMAGNEAKAALEVLLLVLAERELEARDDAETFYKAERGRWSERLRHALDTLVTDEDMVNKRSAVAEKLQTQEPDSL